MDKQKLKEAILYIVSKRPPEQECTYDVIRYLLYFVDLEHLKNTGSPLIEGLVWKAADTGPYFDGFSDIMAELIEEGKLKFG